MPSAMALCTLTENAKLQEQETLTKNLQEILTGVNHGLEQHERLSKLIVLPEEWTISNGLLTPTLKIKRKMIDASFSDRYETWSRQPEPIVFA